MCVCHTEAHISENQISGHPLWSVCLTMMLLPAAGPMTGERCSPFAATPEGRGMRADRSGSVPWCIGDLVVGKSRDSGTLLVL